MKERRKHERLEDRNRTQITVLSAPKAHDLEYRSFSCFTGDVSQGGVSLCVPHPVPVGAKLEMVVSSSKPRRRAWHVGRVVWVRKHDGNATHLLGVRFMSSPEQAIETWQEMLREKFAFAAKKGAG